MPKHWPAIRSANQGDDFTPLIVKDIATGIAVPIDDPDAAPHTVGPLRDWVERERTVHQMLRRLLGDAYDPMFGAGVERARGAVQRVGLDRVRGLVRQALREKGADLVHAPHLGFAPDRLARDLGVDGETAGDLRPVWCYWAVQGALFGVEAVPMRWTANPKETAATTGPAKKRVPRGRQADPARRARAALLSAIPNRIAVAAG